MLIKLTIGDPWNDGHGQHNDFIFKVNVDSVESLEMFHGIGCGTLGFNLKNECEEFESFVLSDNFAEALLSVGITLPLNEELDPIDFALLYLEIAKTANPELRYELVEISSCFVGGYGLYSS
jgi:hypothetical protein